MKVFKVISLIITLFTPLSLLMVIFYSFIGFLYDLNINIIYILILLLIILNIIFILKKSINNDFLFNAKVSLFSNYSSTIISFPPFLGFLFMLPMYTGLFLEHFPNFLTNYSDDIKLLFVFGVIIALLLIWHVIIISISLLYYYNYIKTIYKEDKNEIIKQCIVYFIPVINLVVLMKYRENKILR